MDGFKRPLGTNNTGVPAPATTSGFEGSPETYENAEGAPVEAVKEPQQMKDKTPGKWKKFFLRLLLALVILGLAGAAGWFWYDGQGAKDDLKAQNAKIAELQTTANRYKLAADEATKQSSVTTLDPRAIPSQYALIEESRVANVPDADKASLEKALKDRFQVTSLPSGYMTLAVYKDVKADKTTGKPWRALVYWPATSSKPAAFLDMVQVDSSWKLDETR